MASEKSHREEHQQAACAEYADRARVGCAAHAEEQRGDDQRNDGHTDGAHPDGADRLQECRKRVGNRRTRDGGTEPGCEAQDKGDEDLQGE